MDKIPPFQIGEKVVRTGKSYPEWNMFEGNTYTVTQIEWSCQHRGWTLDTAEETSPYPVDWKVYGARCEDCNIMACGWMAMHFRKLDDIPSGAEMLVKELEAPIGEPVYM